MFGFALLALAVVGCSSGGGDDTNSGSGAISGGGAPSSNPAPSAPAQPGTTTAPPPAAAKTLRDQITDCDAVESKAGDGTSTQDMVQGEQAAADCYRQAVDGHSAEIDQIRKNAGGMQLEDLSLTTQQAFFNYRATKSTSTPSPNLGWCDMGHAISSSFGGTLQQLEDAGCATAIQQRLAKLVAGETTIPGSPLPLAGGDATADFLQTFVPTIVKQMNDNTPGDTAAYTAQVQATIGAMVSATGELCAVLEDAGEMAGGTGERTLLEGCVSKGLGMIAEELKVWTTSPEDQ
jgi:hypothetical protein